MFDNHGGGNQFQRRLLNDNFNSKIANCLYPSILLGTLGVNIKHTRYVVITRSVKIDSKVRLGGMLKMVCISIPHMAVGHSDISN